MLCEFCKQNEASVHFKQVCNGEVREMDICPACAKKHGFEVQSPLAMADFLFGLGGDTATHKPAAPEISCPACHMRPSDFKKTGRLGCPRCYETFAEQLKPMLRNMHEDTTHTGKMLAREQRSRELQVLRADLQEAVARQDFEQAAVLRDRIKEVEAAPPAAVQEERGTRC